MRKRFENSINTWDDVDATFKKIAENEIAIENLEGELNKNIHDIKQDYANKAASYKDEIKELEKEVESFVKANRGDIAGKSMVLNFGSTGFRASTALALPRDKNRLEGIISNLRKKKMLDCINVVESINKEALKKYSEDEIVKLGIDVKKKNVFWYEVNREKLA